MKKLFTLLTLLLSAVVGVQAQTYTDETVTATWSMADGESSACVVAPDVTALSTSWGVGSNMKVQGTGTYFDKKMTTFRTIDNVNSSTKSDGSYVEWTFTPYPGLTFTPTSVSFNMVKIGTGNPSAYVYFIDGEDTEITLAENATIIRNNASNADGLNLSYSLDGKGAASSSNVVKLRVYTGKHNNDKDVGFSDVVITGKVSGTIVATTTYTITAATNDANLGSVSGTATVTENDEVTLTATPTAAGYFVKWKKDDADFAGNTVNPLTVTATADATYTAIFEAKKKISFEKGEGSGTVPATEYVKSGENYVTPRAFFLTKSGSSFSGWSDGVNTYEAGATISNVTEDLTLTALFTANTKVLGDAGVTVDWTFARNYYAPTINCENSELDYVQQVFIDGAPYDAVMHVNTKKGAAVDGKTGKLNNTSNADYAQVNLGTIFSIPAVKGMVVSYMTTSGTPTVSSIGFTDNGSDLETLTDCDAAVDGVLTYKYTGTAATLFIVAKESGFYPSGISVTYPGANEEVITINSYGWATLVSDNILDFTGSTLKAYVVTGRSGNAITLSEELTKVPANTPILLNGAEGSYTIAVTNSASAIATNLLKAGTGAAVSAEAGKTKYALSVEGGKAAFKKIATSATIPVGKAYLEFAEEISAPSLSFNFGETTGIDEVRGKMEDVRGEYYNLAGQRVAQPTKGLYIVNGKKVILK